METVDNNQAYILYGCNFGGFWYNIRTKPMANIQHPSVKVRTTASRGEQDGILFYILPPLLLGAVFVFCAMANSDGLELEDKPAARVSAEK